MATRTAEVTLAGDQKMEFPQTQSGVILAGPEAQPIVPLGSLIRALGYEFVWGRKGVFYVTQSVLMSRSTIDRRVRRFVNVMP